MRPLLVLVTLAIAGCGSVRLPGAGLPDHPENPTAIAPFTVITEGSGPGGDFRIWSFKTSEGMACVEMIMASGAGASCDPTGRPPIGGAGVSRSARGVTVWSSTGAAAAVAAVVHDASGASSNVALIDGGPTLPGIRLAVWTLGPDANPVAIDFLDANGATVESTRLP